MTFLQPFILWGLPLLLVPVIIHLINRLRHKPQPWAAMRFLQTATRSSVSHAKLRQFLILLFRTLAVAMLILFLSRPLAGGWLGWALSPAPDAIVLILDRSASMETKAQGTNRSKREQAIQLLSESAKSFDGASHLVLIDSATRVPQELANSAALKTLKSVEPTQTAADMPQLLQIACNWLSESKAGGSEIWIASDLQKSNWRADDPRWTSVLAQLSALPQKARIRLLAFNAPAENNVALSLEEAMTRVKGNAVELLAAVDVQRNEQGAQPLKLSVELNQSISEREISMEGQYLRWRAALPVPASAEQGYGSFSVPSDANPLDNRVYFTYGKEVKPSVLVASADLLSGKILRLASAPIEELETNAAGKIFSPEDAAGADWSAASLIVWQAPLPAKATADRLLQFIAEGGTVAFFPPGAADSGTFDGLGWGTIDEAPENGSFKIERWNQDEGPLARTEEGLALPVAQAEIFKRQRISGAKYILASFADNAPFLARQTVGRGRFYFCSSLPKPEWSSLGEGPALVPMLQRMSQSGVKRLQADDYAECGDFKPGAKLQDWESVGAPGKNPRLDAGIYKTGGKLVAVNRPRAEDEPDLLGIPETRSLLAAVPTQMLLEKDASKDRLQGEIWRMFVFAMLLFLLAEGWLIMPNRSAAAHSPAQKHGGIARKEEALA
jgi:hypothetical protein